MRVSVIIPTANRPEQLTRALRSVFAQTLAPLEVIVVIDGPDARTAALLGSWPDARLRSVQRAVCGGAGAARNCGAVEASGDWLAFLDDDDEWVPEKLARQSEAAGGREMLVSCRSYVRSGGGEEVWPRLLYDGRVPIDEYLFDRRTLFRGQTHLGTSSFLLPAAVFAGTRFSTDRQNEDTTLLLRLTKQAKLPVLMLPDALVVLNKGDPCSLGSRYEWREMLGWLDGMGGLVTRRAYSGFCLIYLGSQAARCGAWSAFPLLLWRAVTRGSPRIMHVLPFLAFWLFPPRLRQGARRRLQGVMQRRVAC